MSELTPVVEGYFDADGLIGGQCTSCSRRHFPLAAHCPWCSAPEPDSVRLATEGRLWSWTSVGSPPPGYRGAVPFGFGVVELVDDGLQVITVLTESDPSRLALGDAMRFEMIDLDEDSTTWAFAPVGAGSEATS
jgi:uncharacterized protein